ncbi:MAG: hypothetical protein IPJ77_24285 [Planctomycetes bacterium]|nr:hypothetical protein [Planctomycetota bacterium]
MDSSHPANAAILACLERFERLSSYVQSAPRGRVDEWELGAHPDLVSLLWDEVDPHLPKRCAWIVHGRPALVRPKTGVVFGFVSGTNLIVLRVPRALHAAFGLDERFQLRLRHPEGAACEPDWVSAPFERVRELARAAYDAAE